MKKTTIHRYEDEFDGRITWSIMPVPVVLIP
jgi:hypothetical protein